MTDKDAGMATAAIRRAVAERVTRNWTVGDADLAIQLVLEAIDRRAWKAGWEAGRDAAADCVESGIGLTHINHGCGASSEFDGDVIAEWVADAIRALQPPKQETQNDES